MPKITIGKQAIYFLHLIIIYTKHKLCYVVIQMYNSWSYLSYVIFMYSRITSDSHHTIVIKIYHRGIVLKAYFLNCSINILFLIKLNYEYQICKTVADPI